jgi:hypothetical protein
MFVDTVVYGLGGHDYDATIFGRARVQIIMMCLDIGFRWVCEWLLCYGGYYSCGID